MTKITVASWLCGALAVGPSLDRYPNQDPTLVLNLSKTPHLAE